MFRRLSILALLALIGVTPTPRAHAQSQTNAESQPALRYGGDQAFRPYEWSSPTGTPLGFQVELLNAISKATKRPISINLDRWSTVHDRFLTGEIDVVAMFQNDAREGYADFCDAHAVEYSQIFIRKGGPPFQSLDQLAGHEVLVQKSALAQEFMRTSRIDAIFIEATTEEDALKRLAAGEADAAVITQSGGRLAMHSGPFGAALRAKLTTSGPPVLPSNVAFAVRNGEDATRQLINEGLAKLRASGQFEDIYQRWFSEYARAGITLEEALALAGLIGTPLAIIAAIGWFSAARNRRKAVAKQKALDQELQQRKRTETALRAAEDRLKIAMAGSDIMVAHQDTDLRYIWVSNSALNCDEQNVIGKRDEDIFPSTVAARLTEFKRRCVDTGESFRETFPLPRGKDARWFEVIAEPRREAGGLIVGLTAAAIDVTDIKRGEFRRLELERRLASAQKLESLGLLAGGVAHDFNNLLVGVTGNASLLETEIKPQSRAATLLAGIQNAASMAAELTRSLLDYTGRGRFDAIAIDLAQPVNAAINAISPRLNPAIPVQHQALGPAPAIADPTQIRQIVMNLVQNAVDSCLKHGSGSVTVRTGTTTLNEDDIEACANISLNPADKEAITPPGTYALLEVEDTGSGFDEATAQRIFDPFFTTKPTGRGLGLAIIAGVVRRHQGLVQITAAPGQGATFRIYIPTSRTPNTTHPTPRTPAAVG